MTKISSLSGQILIKIIQHISKHTGTGLFLHRLCVHTSQLLMGDLAGRGLHKHTTTGLMRLFSYDRHLRRVMQFTRTSLRASQSSSKNNFNQAMMKTKHH